MTSNPEIGANGIPVNAEDRMRALTSLISDRIMHTLPASVHPGWDENMEARMRECISPDELRTMLITLKQADNKIIRGYTPADFGYGKLPEPTPVSQPTSQACDKANYRNDGVEIT